ncbi:glycerophosphodiester phosphodiesterase family protein [Marivirga lumbricoides]
MRSSIFILLVLIMFSNCSQKSENHQSIDWQGHRGARGNFPENTWRAFQYAIDQNMNTMEMDVVITKDRRVVLSHEPFLNHQICKDTTGNPITEEQEQSYNIYEMNYDELQKFDCGSIQNPNFPQQKPVANSPKPLLTDIIQNIKSYTKSNDKELPYLNVEIKYEEGMKNIFHPEINEFSDLLYKVLSENYPAELWNIQSFDFNVLKYFHQTYPKVKLAALVYESGDYKEQFNELDFTPEIYSPYHELVEQEMVNDLHKQSVKIIPWTVNDEKQAERLIRIGVDGIITDYPELAHKFRKNP